FVGPAFSRAQNFWRDTGALDDDVETEYWIALSFRLGERTAVNGVDNGTRIFKADAFADPISTPTPAGVHQPDPRLVLSHLFRKQLGVLARVPNEEWSAEAG